MNKNPDSPPEGKRVRRVRRRRPRVRGARRDTILRIRITDSDADWVNAQARARGVSTSAYGRWAILSHPLPPAPVTCEMINELHRLSIPLKHALEWVDYCFQSSLYPEQHLKLLSERMGALQDLIYQYWLALEDAP